MFLVLSDPSPGQSFLSLSSPFRVSIQEREMPDWQPLQTSLSLISKLASLLYLRPSPQDVVQFQSATHWGFHVAKEDQRHAIAGRQSNESIFGLSPDEFLCFSNSFLQMKKQLLLLIHR